MAFGSWRETLRVHKNGIFRPLYSAWKMLLRYRVSERISYFGYGFLPRLSSGLSSAFDTFSSIFVKPDVASPTSISPRIVDNVTMFCAASVADALTEDRKHEYIMPSPLTVSIVPCAIVHPMEMSETKSLEYKQYGGVTDDNFTFVESSAHKRCARELNVEYFDCYIGANPAVNRKSVTYFDEDVVFGGFFHSHFGHFLTESLSRLWYFLDKKDDAKRIVCIGNGWVPSRFLDLVALFGVNHERLLYLDRSAKFKNVIVPEQSMVIHGACHRDFKRIIDRIKENITPKKFKKVYFSKKYFGGGRSIGEDAICNIFKANGYKVFFPELMAMKDVIAVLKGCESFAASSGTNAHTAVFLEDGAEFICLNRSPHTHYIQTMIDLISNIHTVYVDSYIDILPTTGHGPFLFGMNEHLLSFFEYKNFTYSLKKYYNDLNDNVYEFLKVWGDYYTSHDLRNGTEVISREFLAKKLSQYLHLKHEYHI